MREVQIFVEGGGTSKTKAQLRSGFGRFFEKAGVTCRVVTCGGRDATFGDWKRATLSSKRRVVNFLLVDSEAPVEEGRTPWLHLGKTDPSWQAPSGSEAQCHFMVQMMEAWFLADPEALAKYYGQHFGAKALPARENVELIAKADVERSLKEATKKTQKGEYHKIRHGAELLARIDPAKVRKRAPHFERLLTTLAKG